MPLHHFSNGGGIKHFYPTCITLVQLLVKCLSLGVIVFKTSNCNNVNETLNISSIYLTTTDLLCVVLFTRNDWPLYVPTNQASIKVP